MMNNAHEDDSDQAQRLERAEERMHAALFMLPENLTAAYREALRQAPQVAAKESNPLWFLR